MRRSRNSYMMRPRSVTFAPMACSSRSLKFEIAFLEMVVTGRWPLIVVNSDLAISKASLVSCAEPIQVLMTTFEILGI